VRVTKRDLIPNLLASISIKPVQHPVNHKSLGLSISFQPSVLLQHLGGSCQAQSAIFGVLSLPNQMIAQTCTTLNQYYFGRIENTKLTIVNLSLAMNILSKTPFLYCLEIETNAPERLIEQIGSNLKHLKTLKITYIELDANLLRYIGQLGLTTLNLARLCGRR